MLRPDRFVFGIAAPGQGAAVVTELARRLGIVPSSRVEPRYQRTR
ncbi:hypothetical protein [Nocardia beijingensis]|nr:hypothetical protein [Nocardia beijingensis]